MTLIAKPQGIELMYRVSFGEPIFDPFEDKNLMALLTKINKSFGVRLNDIKINKGALSDGLLIFSVFEGKAWFQVSYGVEEVSATLTHPQSEEQADRFYLTLAEYFEDHPLNRQLITLRYHLVMEEDATVYLGSLNPHVPDGFKDELESKGVSYTLKVPEDELSMYISLSASLLVKGGLFFVIEYDFSPNKYDFAGALTIVKKRLASIQEALGMKIEAAVAQ